MGTKQTSAQAAHAEPKMPPESSKQMDRVPSLPGAAGQLGQGAVPESPCPEEGAEVCQAGGVGGRSFQPLILQNRKLRPREEKNQPKDSW